MYGLLLPLLFYPAQVLSAQGSNFDVSRTTAGKFLCGKECYEILEQTNKADLEITGADFDQSFYNVGKKFAGSKPGDLLKLKPVDPTTMTSISGVSVYKIQYTSQDLDGSPVPVSGYIAMPFSLPKSGAFPMIAFAHGTIGIYPGCAVSNSPNLFEYADSWSALSKRGYAVVATDYAGLGVNGTEHKYLTLNAHAADVFHSVTAARQAFGDVLSKEWLSVGHSQGGGAAWKLGEDIEKLAAEHGSGSCEAANYIGTVAVSPATKVYDFWMYFTSQVMTRPDFHRYSLVGLAPLAAVSAKRVFPKFGYSIFGKVMRTRLGLADRAQTCAAGTAGLTLDLPAEEIVAPARAWSAEDMSILKRWQEMSAPANGGRSKRPILIVQGLNDTAVPAPLTISAFNAACGYGNEIKMLLYPKQDHSGVLEAAAPEWLRWIDERFAGKATSGSCKKITKKPFDYEFVRAAPELDITGLGL
ncbi:secretory lipase [Diplodia corticola]|uniref:Secretory lipase n=1 Tax=Diplodia corticola TaxID=236234 RepID=A0A1J9S344_9PEZI|nr:secretory lipase [Diplodia corticola]OJD34053.1 secretory lipase [Diplodia corticola]